ncbi:chemotaxis protein CheW [Succinivibrio dextrinosolvens]|uniref:chemotaxis protein CheW n=1 Tax=Succinivibrio dextrinosolvens TaxID=83771 RepID=UPI00241CDC62|nr:chemotaxis protein CheW [Succinivibrio dextrinosolvens]MBE6424002.1 hypothetical protein [Succinivibrio dextrinosolvens]
MNSYSVLNDYGIFLFRLNGTRQCYAVHVSRVQEVMPCPRITVMPKLQKHVVGVATIHNTVTIPVIDLAEILCGRKTQNIKQSLIVVVKSGNSKFAFLASKADRIININDNALLPSEIDSSDTYMIGAVQVQNELVELIDVDKVISDVLNPKSENDSAQDIHSEQEKLYSAGIC